MKYACVLAVAALSTAAVADDRPSQTARQSNAENAAIDFPGFVRLAEQVAPIREKRRVSEDEFLRLASEPGTIILDTRSAAAYAAVHVEGAVHLNFSDITKQRIAEVIPDKATRVLIYCNNNFESPLEALMDKRIVAALNIPTFITLHEYGYRNVYELGPRVDAGTTKLKLVSSPGD